MIVTAHQPNYLPGQSVIDKLLVSDAIIWLDEVQYTKGGFTNRNRLPDASWLTVPVERGTDGEPINRVRIAEHGRWREKNVRSILQHYRHATVLEDVVAEHYRPYGLLVGLNLALLRIVLDAHKGPPWFFQSHLDGGHAVTAVSESAEELLPISERLAMMVAEVGGDCYLSGSSGRRYLDEKPFVDRGIKIEYYDHQGPNPCILELMS